LKKKKNLGFFLGSLVDLETIILSKYLANYLGSSDVYSDYNVGTSSNLDFRSNYSVTSFEELKNSDLCLIIGSDLRSESPTLNLMLKKQVTEGLLTVGYIGPSTDLLYPSNHLGLGINSLVSLLQGKHPFSSLLKKSKNPHIILGEKFNSGNISNLVYSLVDSSFIRNLNYNNIHILRSKSSSIGLSELGLNSLRVSKEFEVLFLIGVDDLKPYRLSNPNSFIIYIGSHYSVFNLEMADLILPSSIFLEKDFKIINLENIVKENKSLRKISGDVRSEYFLLLVIISLFNDKLNNLNLKKLRIFDHLFGTDYPFIFTKNFKLSDFNIYKAEKFLIRKEIFHRSIFNFYQDNYLLRSSKNFKFCLDNLKQVKFKKNNVV
jgi:NADH dehydrogenase/NADH:ubiquinone oxidoreductase subunit G